MHNRSSFFASDFLISPKLSMRKIFVFVFFLSSTCLLQANAQQQPWPFADEIQAFQKEDSLQMPKAGGILFVGSSSIRLWNDLKQRFSGYDVIQRGFGGCELKDVVHYADRIVLPYQPSKIFLYAGENDVANGKKATEVRDAFVDFYNLVHKELPDAHIYFISIKPSPSREKFMPAFSRTNERIRRFILRHPKDCSYIYAYQLMLDAKGMPRPELFRDDSLHMNKNGYDIWETLIRPYL